jgi:pimeloyl-ACP methyl ester carboxylesterase
MGGYIAFRIAALAPQRILGLVLIATRAARDDKAVAGRRRASARLIENGGKDEFLDAFVPRLVGASTRQRAPRLLAELRAFADTAPAATLAGCQRGMLARPDSRPLLARLAVPALVIAGSEDELISRAESDELAGLLPLAELAAIPAAGHTPSLERPIATSEVIAGFLARHFPAPPGDAARAAGEG